MKVVDLTPKLYKSGERWRGNNADHADCIDADDSIIDMDDSIIDYDDAITDGDDAVYDGDDDGLLPEEVKAYELELKEMENFCKKMTKMLGWAGFEKWKRRLAVIHNG